MSKIQYFERTLGSLNLLVAIDKDSQCLEINIIRGRKQAIRMAYHILRQFGCIKLRNLRGVFYIHFKNPCVRSLIHWLQKHKVEYWNIFDSVSLELLVCGNVVSINPKNRFNFFEYKKPGKKL